MKKIPVVLSIATLTLALLQPAAADAPELAKGDVAPEFDLIDEAGESVKLSDYRDKKRVILVFSRAHW
jgi:peroxiredoxin